MARLPRYVLPGQPQHVIQRGNNREPIFAQAADYAFYLEKLKRIGVRLELTHYGTIAGENKSLSKDATPIENVGLVYAARVAMAQSTIRHCQTNLYRF